MVNPIGAKVRWNEQYATGPDLEIAVDAFPPLDELVYDLKKVGAYTLAFAEKDGYVSFFAHDPRNESGYGGTVFDVMTTEGQKKFKGPWSSRSGQMNHHFTQSVDVRIADDIKVLERGHTFYSGNVTLEFAKRVVDEFLPGIAIINVTKFPSTERDISYEIIKVEDYENNKCDHGDTGFGYRCRSCRLINWGGELEFV